MQCKPIFTTTLILGILVSSSFSLPPSGQQVPGDEANHERIYDTDTWIDANKVLMFVTNKGSFSYDQGGILGKSDGFYYPFFGVNDIQNGTATNTVVFAAGIWIAGTNASTGDTLVSVAEYSDDYFPGPMVGGTYISGANVDPAYRVYKLYKDSLASNPNQDYLQWPVAQGAPTDGVGNPILIGDQTLWSVFNDANPAPHTNDASSNNGLGVEIQHTVWASDQPGNDTLPHPVGLPVYQRGTSGIEVRVEIIVPTALTGFDYMVVTGNDSVLGAIWHLINVSTGDTVLANQITFSNDNSTVTDGFLVKVSNPFARFEAFEVVANSNGALDPPSGGALGFQGFPSLNPDSWQQVGPARWAFHTGDNGGSSGGGTRGSYEAFLTRILRGTNALRLGFYDYEMRFTGSYTNPGVGGSYAIRRFQDNSAVWVPFELWRIGVGTPDDPTDDLRLTTWIWDGGDDLTYNLESWGTSANGGGEYEHSASGADDDPYTDWVYWYLPNDTTPGQSGYLADEAGILAGTYTFDGLEVMARTVLINWNGGEQPPFNQDLPEQGTIFRLRTPNEAEIDTFDFITTPPPTITIGPEAVSIYSKHRIINKSGNTYNDFFISFWFDPDLGNAGDDYVGCDTLNDMFFCYNDGADSDYGSNPPAFGGKLIEGPIVPSAGDTAYVDGQPLPGFKNVNMYSFMMYINGTDPQSYRWTYQYMNGLDASQGGIPLANGTRYAFPGDPVAGTGDLDFNSSDRRMMATFGPFDFAPGDTQQIVVKLGVGHGSDRLASITELKDVLNFLPSAEPVLVASVRPDPQRIILMNTIDPFMDTVFLGWSDGRPVDGINGLGLAVNDTLVPISADIVPSHPDFSGPVWRLVIAARDFLQDYGYTYDTTTQPFSVSGQFVDETPINVAGTFTLIGHRRGDINRNGSLDITDLTFLVDHIFRGGPEPDPVEAGDIDRDEVVSIVDLTIIIDYIFRGGK